ncbi:MAG: right-handed parallel beta-helix repeat-containing protein [Flavobacteriales bacterium]|nr:right-handed parallel beta-helix repeat-containing protein [Flavobacteriales bacterium]
MTTATASLAQETRYLDDFATPGGGGYPNDTINDHEAFVDAAAFFQARNGDGTLILRNGEYIMGAQQLHPAGSPPLAAGWEADVYPPGYPCQSVVANQRGFRLDNCTNFTIKGGANTKVRYRDCLLYGTFLRDEETDSVLSAVAANSCITCGDSLKPILEPNLMHAKVGIMFYFSHCDSIAVRDVELDGNIDAAILGGSSFWDDDGIMIWESSRCDIDNVYAHHFGRDGLLISGSYNNDTIPFQDVYPIPVVEPDPDSSGTVIFNNTIRDSRFEWNGRQGISWTACAGLDVSDCDMNYNGAGRITSSPSSGLDIEGGGGPMRVRYGVFDECRFLHNRGVGIISDPVSGPCLGQQDFRFNDCLVKARGERCRNLAGGKANGLRELQRVWHGGPVLRAGGEPKGLPVRPCLPLYQLL